MVLRRYNLILLASLAALALALSGPVTGTAHANACETYGTNSPAKVTTFHARKAIRCLLNQKRANHGLNRLKRNHRLSRAATKHTKYMNSTGCFAHQCPGEPSILARLEHVNYIVGGLFAWSYGENLAWGETYLGTPRAIVHAWMHSPEHRHNILNPSFQQVGVGFDRGYPGNPDAVAGTYTTDFGMRHG